MIPLSAAARQAARPRLLRWTSSILVALIVVLPVLLAFVRLDTEPDAAEQARVEAAVSPQSKVSLSPALQLFYRSMAGAGAETDWQREPVVVTKRARLAGMLALFGLSGLIYVLLLLVRGRATASAGCLGLCMLPAFGEDGVVLRPEQCASLFGLLAVVLMAGFPLMLQVRRRRMSDRAAILALLLVVGISLGTARSCHTGAWIYLAVPAGALLMSVMTLVLILPRAVRGKPWLLWPTRAAARRYVPWMFLVLCSFGLTLLALSQGVPNAPNTVMTTGLLPENPWLAAGLILVGTVGGLRMALGVGLRIGRLRRVRPDTVLFLFVAALIMQHFLQHERYDRLPAATAYACLLGDGAMTILVLGLGAWRRRRRTSG